ncbi:OprD family porin [Ectopseudomonas mendocina]|uniref:OprD family porin n=1 Tax=Ectopseudomonas mendocina TaxID=300 RepID=A0ABZ2RD31_ECTME
MLGARTGVLALGILAATQAMAEGQADSQGFVEDSHLDLFFRNAYINRDYKNGSDDKAEWGQTAEAYFKSGFTQGTVGVGVDAFALYALRLDGGKGRAGAGGIDFFKVGDSGEAADQLSRLGGAVKFRVSNTVLKYGDQMPQFPVLNYDNSRLLPESFTGTLLTSKEIEGLEINVGRFTQETRKSTSSRDSGELDRLDVWGIAYQFTDNFKASYYGTNIKDVLDRHYVNMNYVIPLSEERSLTLDFNDYYTSFDRDFGTQLNAGTDGSQSSKNNIWSLAATYAFGPHALTLAHQRSTGDSGYNYGGYRSNGWVGDGGTSIFLSNSYWSDFNAEDERSWQLAYDLDFAAFGVPGLSWRTAYVRGDNINDRSGRGEGTEREIFNQVKYVVQSGPAKDLNVRVRSSILRVSNNASNYNADGNEVRVFVDYPINVF